MDDAHLRWDQYWEEGRAPSELRVTRRVIAAAIVARPAAA